MKKDKLVSIADYNIINLNNYISDEFDTGVSCKYCGHELWLTGKVVKSASIFLKTICSGCGLTFHILQ